MKRMGRGQRKGGGLRFDEGEGGKRPVIRRGCGI
jgi:hypothetical protein